MFISLPLYCKSSDLFEMITINTEYIVAIHRPNNELKAAGFKCLIQFAPNCTPIGFKTGESGMWGGLVAVDEEFEVLSCMLTNDTRTLRIIERDKKRQEREEASKQRALARAEKSKPVNNITDLHLHEKEETLYKNTDKNISKDIRNKKK